MFRASGSGVASTFPGSKVGEREKAQRLALSCYDPDNPLPPAAHRLLPPELNKWLERDSAR